MDQAFVRNMSRFNLSWPTRLHYRVKPVTVASKVFSCSRRLEGTGIIAGGAIALCTGARWSSWTYWPSVTGSTNPGYVVRAHCSKVFSSHCRHRKDVAAKRDGSVWSKRSQEVRAPLAASIQALPRSAGTIGVLPMHQGHDAVGLGCVASVFG